MQRASLYMLLLLIIISACTQRKWDEDKISDKLKTVFPSATIHVMDSFAIKKDRPDIFDMPLPVYKASIKEEKNQFRPVTFFHPLNPRV